MELTPELRKEYLDNWSNCSIKPNYQRDLDQAVSQIEKHQSRYKSVSEETSVPWYVIAIIHGLEASYKFNTHLHNGDPLTGLTIN
ncbi:hypothetical protein [Nodularia spumigena]|uniref:hypothetical protein n=1 Tax=Nodularia spumigena TaxID=70799 RepID=UPI000D31DF16|nr:hypothetical protein [Nodularia spumigena]